MRIGGKRFFINSAKYKPLGPPPMHSSVKGEVESKELIVDNLSLNYLPVK
jgi:hypothetical protein